MPGADQAPHARALRRFLYVSPYFPPMTRVGALRPLKFARRLPEFGWAPVVLADLAASDAVDLASLRDVPPSTIVAWDFSRAASRARAALEPKAERSPAQPTGRAPSIAQTTPGARAQGLGAVIASSLERTLSAAGLLPSPEWLPLGLRGLEIPHAIRAGLRTIRAHRCEAIVVNADPWVGLVVGGELARASGLPLILDLRDPWSLCELRRPQRPPPQRRLVDALERRAFSAAHAVILNTQHTRDQYAARYADLPAERFVCIRNHADAELLAHGPVHPPPAVFTALFMGHLRRFVEGDVLIDAVVELRRRGIGPERFQLWVSGGILPASRARIDAQRVGDMIVDHAFVPHRETGAFMESADVLVALNVRSDQRIPAKVFDYATTDRPMVVASNAPELARLLAELGGAQVCSLDDPIALADALAAELDRGRRRRVARDHALTDTRTASRRLAGLLDAAVAITRP